MNQSQLQKQTTICRTNQKMGTLQASDSPVSVKLSTGQIIAGKFKLIDKVGQGSFGMIYKTENLENGTICATKFEKREENQSGISLLVREIKVLIEVQSLDGFPQISFYGRDENYNYFMLTYLGQNLEHLLRRCTKFSSRTILKTALQLLERIEGFHSKNLIHRDLKPDNIVIGYEDVDKIFLIDFGLSKYYRDSKGNHIQMCDKKGIIGTARYASINAHLGKEQSRRDDIESLGYVLVYLAKSKLPWMNIQTANKKEKYQQILELKQLISVEKLCEGLPKCYLNLFLHARSLEFTAEPDYAYLKDQFQKEFDINDILDSEFEWSRLPELRRRKMRFIANQLRNREKSEVKKTAGDEQRKSLDENQRRIKQGEDSSETKKNPSFLNVPLNEQEQIQSDPNGKSRNLSGNLSSFGTSQINHYQISNLNNVEQENYKNFVKDSKRKDKKACTYVTTKVFLKEATIRTVDRKMAFDEIDEDFQDYDYIDKIADDETHIKIQSIIVPQFHKKSTHLH